jgi:hypothetical protein
MPNGIGGLLKEGAIAYFFAKAAEHSEFLFGLFVGMLVVALHIWRRQRRRPAVGSVALKTADSASEASRPAITVASLHNRGNVRSDSFDDTAIERLGIVNCVPTLIGSNFTPEQCRHHTQYDLRFSGLQGTKWVDSDESIADFRHFLHRLRPRPRKSVRFLLVNPFGPSMPEILQARREVPDTKRDLKNLQQFVSLMDDFDFLEVKLFDHFPYFRIVIIDGTEMAVSRYKVWTEHRYGSKGPHLILRNDVNPEDAQAVSLFYAFDQHFEHVWQDLSRSVADVLTTRTT